MPHPAQKSNLDFPLRLYYNLIKKKERGKTPMRIIRPGEKLTKKELRFFAEMAGRAYVNDPVHVYATKNPKRREKFVSHFMMERLNTSNGTDYFYIDDENRGLCVWRKAHNEYGVLDFLKCPDWLYLYWFWPNTLRTLAAYGPLDVKAFEENVDYFARFRRAGASGAGDRRFSDPAGDRRPHGAGSLLRTGGAGRAERAVLPPPRLRDVPHRPL